MNPKTNNNTNSIGKGMIIVAIMMTIGLLTYLFQGEIDKQYNPNQQVQSTQTGNNQIEVTLKRNRAGHYVTTGKINDQKVIFLLDTGATFVAIPEQLTRRLKLKKGHVIPISTANGRTKGYQTRIDKLSIGQIHLYNIKAIITPNLEEILLGMSVLKQLEFTQRGNELTIRQYL
ncbi:MAG: TIGR02281 family clan AA aspartic protease [gamma proteobacterium symbiont of Taylorina sp.]|nr:TIGR02281 family clan AA aspartic protease [gamma proteobacterium symbiont of Taylorina sp.]